MEIFKPVIDYPNYEVSNYGNMRRNNLQNKGRILKGSINNHKYCLVKLYKGEEKKTFTIHRLVASAFIENPSNYPQVNHLDGNKQNNNVDNLEWVSNRENCSHNKKKGETSSSFHGVHWNNSNHKFSAHARVSGKKIHLGCFEKEEDAHERVKEFYLQNSIENRYS